MNPWRLAYKNLVGEPFRNAVVFSCALAVAGFALAVTLILRGGETSLALARERLGADILVVPQGNETAVQNALLMGRPTKSWMPADTVETVRRVSGVAAASPQLYLASLANAACCDAAEMFIVAFDPRTDFTVMPWLTRKMGGGLHLGEAIGGRLVYPPPGEQYLKLYGYLMSLKANLELTGTGLDQSLFTTFDTAREMARVSRTKAEQPLEIPPNSVSAVLVNVQPDSPAHAVALKIKAAVPGVAVITSPDMFQSFRGQLVGLLRGFLLVLGTAWGLSIIIIGLVFSMAVNERRRQIAVLRALGATRGFVVRSVLMEAVLLAVAGGTGGILLGGAIMVLFRNYIVATLNIPLLLPSVPGLLALGAAALVIALLTVLCAVFLPAYRISRQDPALAMRE